MSKHSRGLPDLGDDRAWIFLNSDAPFDEETRARLLAEGIVRATWESAPDGLIEIDSPSWRFYTGQSFDDWKGYGWLTAIHPEDRIVTVQKWRNTVLAQRAVDAEYRLRGQDGNYRWMHVHAVPLRDEDGKIIKWFGVNMIFMTVKLRVSGPDPAGELSPKSYRFESIGARK